MRILFDLRNVGLGNNGGSRTIVRSANTIKNLGYDVKIIDSSKPSYTWDKIDVPHLVVKTSKEVPDADAIIATGVGSVPTTLLAPESSGKKFWYIRGWETWNVNEQKLINYILNPSMTNIVNGLCLQEKLNSYKVKSHLIRPGYDFDEVFFTNNRKNNDRITLGGLLNFGNKRKTKRSEWIMSVYYNLVKEGYPINIEVYGCEKHPMGCINNYFHNPTIEQKNRIYNDVDIWLSPTSLEGLHIAAAEAMLTQCCVIGTSAPMSGTKDYLINGKTGLITGDYFISFYNCVKSILDKKDVREELGKAGMEKVKSLGSREENMLKFVNLIENLC